MTNRIAIDKSLFTATTADKYCRCAGCGGRIIRGESMFTKPFYYRNTQRGLTRLHNLDTCWDEWSDHVAQQVALGKEIGVRP